MVPLSNPVARTTNEEVWLANLTSVMHHTLHLLLEAAPTTAQRKDWSIDPTKFPSQVLGHKNMCIVMSGVHYGWGSFLDVLCLFLWSSTVVYQLMLNLCTLVRVLISTPLGFWYLHVSLYAMSHLHFRSYHTFPNIGHCLHATLTCTDTCTARVQLKLNLCHLHSPLYCPSSHLLCLHGHT